MRCRDFVARLDARRSGELGPGTRLGMYLHALLCRACAAYQKSYERTAALVTWAYQNDTDP